MTSTEENASTEKKVIIAEGFEQEVRAWTNKYKKVKFLEIGAEETTEKKDGKDVIKYIPGKVVYFRTPTRQEMSAAENLSINEDGKIDSYKKAEKLMVDCYLGGQITLEEILEEIETYMAVASFCLYNLVETKNVNWGSC